MREREIDAATRGVWKLTARRRARATGSAQNTTEELLLANQRPEGLSTKTRRRSKGRIISELQSRIDGVEQFCVSLLGPLGYQQLKAPIVARTVVRWPRLFRQGVDYARRFQQNAGIKPLESTGNR